MTANSIPTGAPKILIVEDELTIALDMERTLEKVGFQISGSAQAGPEALALIENLHPDLVLMDIRLQGQMDGIDTAAAVRDRWNLPVVFVTANSDDQLIARAKQTSAYGFLTKPFRAEELNATIRLALHQHQLTQNLFAEHAWFTNMLKSLGDGVIATDAEGFVRYVNPAAEALTGWAHEEAVGKPIEEVYPLVISAGSQDDLCQLRRTLKSEIPVGKQRFHLKVKDGEILSVEDSATPIMEAHRLLGAVTVFRDISLDEKTEQALRESEKLAVVGRLAASISHEINNPLEAITNLLYLAERELSEESPVMAYIQQANAELARVTHIATETLRFHRQTRHKTQVQLTTILESVLTLHHGRVRSLQVSVERRYRDTSTPTVFASEIRQVFANLIGNALDAVGQSTDRRLVLRVCDATCWRTHRRGVRVTVADTGAGISRSVGRHIFKAFFTTKSATGTGLGLWISFGIVEKHNGWIHFRSTQDEPRHGTVFSVFLPN